MATSGGCTGGLKRRASRWEVLGGVGKYEGLEGAGYTFYPGELQEVEAQGGWTQAYDGALIFKSPP